MDFSVCGGSLEGQRTDCIVLGVYEGRKLSAPAMTLDATAIQAIDHILAAGDLEGELGTTLLLHTVLDLADARVLLVGLGPEGELSAGSYRAALSSAVHTLGATGAKEARFCLDGIPVKGRDGPWKIEQQVLAIMDGQYRFEVLKSKPTPHKSELQKVILLVADREDESACRAAIARAAAIAEGIVLAKDLGNMPGNLCTPTYLAQQAVEVGKCHGLKVEIIQREEIERLGMGAFLAVARGSLQPPKLIVMEYRGAGGHTRPIVLVGKGITFDAGGISIKPALEMDEMKFDMCGAASVFGALRAAAIMQLPLDVVGIIPAAENMPGGNATRPGDIVRTMSGQTVEILDTDSEGRLALCDALTFARKYEPAAVVDIATLTGEIVSALGHVASGLFSNCDALAREIVDAGERAWDRVWRMPLWEEYQEDLKSNFADLPNIGSHADSAVTAACFLSRFTGAYPWAHLDIAGTASRSGPDKGATGRPVALLAHFLAARAQRTDGP